MSYYYADKALGYFKKTNNYLGSIKAESLMLLQLSRDMHMDFHDLAERYENLIQDCESLGFLDQKGMLLNNVGYEYYNREDYALARNYFKEALTLTEKGSATYLSRFCNYTDACLEGRLCHDKQLEKQIQTGLQLSKNLHSTLYLKLFKLFSLQVKHCDGEYVSYLEREAIPYFLETKNVLLIERYGKVLYEHYVEKEELHKAIQLSRQLDHLQEPCR